MKKYFLLLFFVVVLFASGKVLAQNDTFSFVFKKFPTQHYDYFVGCGGHNDYTDTLWNYEVSGSFISDSLFRSNSSITFLNRDTTKKTIERLMVSYNVLTKTIDSLSYSRTYDTIFKGYNVSEIKNFSFSGMKITDQNGNLNAVILGDSLSHKGRYTYRNEAKLTACEYDEIYTFLNNFTDSTSLTFQMTNREFLGAAVPPPIFSDITLYPNPASEYVHFQIPDMNVKEITIADLLGRNVLSSKIPSDNQTLDISTLSPGIYYVRMGRRVEKLIVRR